MAKLRPNHTRSKRPMGGLLIRVFMMLAAMAVLFVMLYRGLEDMTAEDGESQEMYEEGGGISVNTSGQSNGTSSAGGIQDKMIPSGSAAEIVTHQYYTLGYSEKYEQAEWVSYLLTRENLKIPNVKRHDRFERDPLVSTGSAGYYDYRGSGYSRGHMAPAGDMAQNETAMRESFYMSNMSPQKIPFNGGIWRELEECVRDWTYTNGNLYVVTGPILNTVTEYIGKESKVGVPQEYYKVVLDYEGGNKKAIGFIMPNEESKRPIMDYAVSVDEVERRTGLNFFVGILDSRVEEQVESNYKTTNWKVSDKRYNTRVKNWNNR